MTIDTIKDVLGRIISINKNLTAESLRNLLTASGWDMHDINEGLKVFQDFNYTGEKSVVQTPTQVPQKTTPAVVQVPTQVLIQIQEQPKIEIPKDIGDFMSQQRPGQIDNSLSHRAPQTVSLDPIPQRPSVSSAPVYQPSPTYQPPIVQIIETPPTIITQNTDSNNKEWGIISLDIILFLVILGLLLYILLK